MRRDDLLALDADKLVTLANKGLVKRALKELEAGKGPSIEVSESGVVVAVLEGVETRLAPDQALRDTSCSCGALKVCRHRVMAVLAYQAAAGGGVDAEGPAESWSPAAFTDAALLSLLGRWAYGRAERRRRSGYVAEIVRPGETADVPTVELPTCTVRFLVPDSLSYARCDCEVGVKCEHVALAVWAWREADARQPESARITVEVGTGARVGLGALDGALELGRELLLDGAVGSGAALGARFARAKKPLTEAKLLWPLTLCEDLEEALASYSSRAASYRPTRIGDLLTELHARARAATHEGEVPARAILGTDEPMETRLEHLRLVSLGVRLSHEAAEGDKTRVFADIFLADPDTLTVVVLRRHWDVGEDEVGPSIARRHVQSGMPLGTLARGQMVTKAARRRANRLLVLGRGGVGKTSVTPQRGEWDLFGAPLFVRQGAELSRTLRERPPTFVRPRLLAERVHVLAISEVSAMAYHAGDQVLSAEVLDEVGEPVRLELEHSLAAPRAIDALALALGGAWGAPRYVSGEVRRVGEQLVMTPLSVVADRVIALDVEEPEGERELPMSPLSARRDPIHEALAEIRTHLDLGAHQGLRHVTGAWREELAKIADHLEQVGLRYCADRARDVIEGLAGRHGGSAAGEEALALAWLDASLRVRLCLEAA